MHKKTFLSLFIGTHIVFVILLIHKQSYVVKLSFTKQRLEKKKLELIEQKKNLTNTLIALQNRSSIKEYASSRLGMAPISLDRIKKLSKYEEGATTQPLTS